MFPIRLLRGEALIELALLGWLYARTGSSWWLFAGLFLTPDLGMLAYLANPRAGAWGYNALHTYMLAMPLAVAGQVAGSHLTLAIGLIWCAHIAFDRAFGYGLKFPESFGSTHLGRLGRPARPVQSTHQDRQI